MARATVVKVGGALFGAGAPRSEVLRDFARLPGHKVLVHGGGARATQLGEQLGTPARMLDGRRLTDAATLEIVTMVYAGQLNTTLVAGLQALNCASIGLTGADGDLVRARRRPVTPTGIDYGYAGDVVRINTGLIRQLWSIGLTPVVCALSHDGAGQILNTNADTIAAELAAALSEQDEVTLHFCTDRPGVLRDIDDETSTLPELDPERYAQLRADGTVAGGMLPKLDNAFATLRRGVQEVVISGLRLNGPATRLHL